MPLLPPEPSLFPEDLLTAPLAPPEDGGPWWVLHTRPRAEKSLARQLLSRGQAFYLPLHHREWRSAGRLFRSYLPLFPGYLFLHGSLQARVQALETNLVVQSLVVPDQQRLHDDLARLARLIDSGAPLTAEDRLQPGDWVEIVSGPLAGCEGKILRRGKQCRLFVEVQFLQCGVSVEIDARTARPLERGRELVVSHNG